MRWWLFSAVSGASIKKLGSSGGSHFDRLVPQSYWAAGTGALLR